MGEKRHFEPVKRAEPRFPENPTNHSSPPARRRQKIAPLRHSSPPLRPSRPHRHLPTSFAHSVCLILSPFFPAHPSLADTDPTVSNTTTHHSILFTFPDPSVFYLSLLRGIAAHNSPSLLPFLVDPPPQFAQSELWQNTKTAQSRHYSHHLNIFLRIVFRVFPPILPTLPVCRATLPKPSLPHLLSPPHIDGASKSSLCKRLRSPSSRATMVSRHRTPGAKIARKRVCYRIGSRHRLYTCCLGRMPASS